MGVKDNINADLLDDSKKERQGLELTEERVLDENINKIDIQEKKENEEINKGDINNDNEEIKNSYIKENLDPLNDNKGNSNANLNGLITKEHIVSSISLSEEFSISQLNSDNKNLENTLIREDKENNLNNENTHVIIDKEKNDVDVPYNEIKTLESFSLNVNSKFPISQKKNKNTAINDAPLYIEVKGLLEVLNAQDFAKKVNRKNADLNVKAQNALIKKRSYSVPNKAVAKNIPKD
ncbi:conserved Plasmodium protein, unknown function, partial [Plasmodium sp. DRC-Itaito]